MRNLLLVTLAVAALSSLPGCEQDRAEHVPQSVLPGASSAPPSGAPPAPTADPSLPPVGSVTAPNQGDGPTAAGTRSTLTPSEQNTAMPLPGQVNDHSTQERAKQGETQVKAGQ